MKKEIFLTLISFATVMMMAIYTNCGSEQATSVDRGGPSILSVSSSSNNGSYCSGSILIDINLDEVVEVAGEPRLKLNVEGPNSKYATYTHGSGTKILTFTYRVGPEDKSAELDYDAIDALKLNGGTIQNSDGGSINTTLPKPGSSKSLSDSNEISIEQQDLCYLQIHKHGDDLGNGNFIDGLDTPTGAVVSPDGKYVYIAGFISDSIVVFRRDEFDGTLIYQSTCKDGDDQGNGQSIDGLVQIRMLAISPDGKNMYVTGIGGSLTGSIAVFSRNEFDGTLTYQGIKEQGGSEGALTIDGLSNSMGLAISPNGLNIYVAGFSSDAIAIFSRNESDGSLTYQGVKKHGANEGALTIDGLDGPIYCPHFQKAWS